MENNTPEQKPLTLQERAEELYPLTMVGGGITSTHRQLQQNAYIKGYKHASQQTEALQAEIERLNERLDKDINALLHLGMVKDEQIQRLKNIIKDGKLGN
jgi:hypothetical protein